MRQVYSCYKICHSVPAQTVFFKFFLTKLVLKFRTDVSADLKEFIRSFIALIRVPHGAKNVEEVTKERLQNETYPPPKKKKKNVQGFSK